MYIPAPNADAELRSEESTASKTGWSTTLHSFTYSSGHKRSRSVCVERHLCLRSIAFALIKRLRSVSFVFCCTTIPLRFHLHSVVFVFRCMFRCISFPLGQLSIAFAFVCVPLGLRSKLYSVIPICIVQRLFCVHSSSVLHAFIVRS